MHHIDDSSPRNDETGVRAGEPPFRTDAVSDVDPSLPWYKLLTRYHWFVLIVSVLGWLFDTMDQQLFNLARGPAITELMGSQYVRLYGGIATMVFMIGWATGGIVFGVMGDRIGRAKTMVLTILVYSICTGLSSFSVGFWDFAAYRFLTGLGVGGEFAVGIALVAEVMPERARTPALGWLQACSAIGNITAAFIAMALSSFEAAGELGAMQPWRIMFIIGALPALLALLIRRRLKEPERWLKLRENPESAKKLGSFTELLSHPTWRKHAILGLILATSGVVGLWGIGFFGFDLVRSVFNENFRAEARSEQSIKLDSTFVHLIVTDPSRLETIGTPGAAKEQSRLELALEKVKVDHVLDPTSAVLYESVLALAKEKHDINDVNILAMAAKKADKVEEAKRKHYDSAALQKQLRTTVPSNDTFAEALAKISERAQEIGSRLTFWSAIYGLLFNIGAFFGIYAFARISQHIGRRPSFMFTFFLAGGTTAFAFWNLSQFSDIFWMVPLMGFAQIALFGGYAVYFPELFPTQLRSTGISFCYNVGRYLASGGPLILGALASQVFGHHGEVLSWRYAGVTMCSFFLLGLLVLPFLPETKDQPLPE